MKDFVLLSCGTYFIEDNTILHNTIVIIYDNTLPGIFKPVAQVAQRYLVTL